MAETFGLHPAPMTAQMFVNAGMEHMEKYGGVRPREDDRQKPLATYPLYIFLRILYL